MTLKNMSDIEEKLGHQKNQKILWQKNNKHLDEQKQTHKAFFEEEKGIYIVEKLAHDVI